MDSISICNPNLITIFPIQIETCDVRNRACKGINALKPLFNGVVFIYIIIDNPCVDLTVSVTNHHQRFVVIPRTGDYRSCCYWICWIWKMKPFYRCFIKPTWRIVKRRRRGRFFQFNHNSSIISNK